MEYADLRAAKNLKVLKNGIFSSCSSLRHVLLGEGLEVISKQCFQESGVEELVVPSKLRTIDECAFWKCGSLKSVSFGADSALEDVGVRAFMDSGLEAFVSPPSLKKICDLAFVECVELKDFQLSESVRELGWLCFWATGVTDLKLPPHVRMTPEQLGIGQNDPRALRLPDGLESVGEEWFRESGVEKLVVPNCVKVL